MSSNPFEPPRTTDLDGDAAGAPGSMVVSPDALRELAAAAPWVRALARFTKANAILLAIGMTADLARSNSAANTVVAVLVDGASIAATTLLLLSLRRYDTASQRLVQASAASVGPIISAHASYLRLCGILAAIAAGIFIVRLVVGIATGNFLAWIYK
jgi:hypothetical protein